MGLFSFRIKRYMKTKLDPTEDAWFLELFERYHAVDEMELQEEEAYHEYKLLLINHKKYNDYLLAFEMDSAGFKLTECCIALDFMIFNSEKKKKAVILKWADGMYGISIHGKKDEMHEIKFCPWCGSKLGKSGS